jgi:hypothetical protein
MDTAATGWSCVWFAGVPPWLASIQGSAVVIDGYIASPSRVVGAYGGSCLIFVCGFQIRRGQICACLHIPGPVAIAAASCVFYEAAFVFVCVRAFLE